MSKVLSWLFPWRPRPRPVPVPPPPPPPTSTPAPGPVDLVALYREVNAARMRPGLPPLAPDGALEAVAARRIARLAAAGRLDHAGYAEDIRKPLPGAVPGEVLAAGQTSAAQVVADWLRDPPHRAELLGDFTLMGAGVAEGRGGMLYWCVDFARV